MTMIPVADILYPSTFPMNYSDGAVLDAAEELMTYCMIVPKTGTLKKIGWRCDAITSPNLTLKISVEQITGTSVPVAVTNATKTLYAAGAESADITSFGATTFFTNFAAINGSTGISVTKGDAIAITFRVTSYTSGSIRIMGIMWAGTNSELTGMSASLTRHKAHSYTGGSWSRWYGPMITLQYDGEIVPVPFTVPVFVNYNTWWSWNSSSDPDRRGMKFKIPYKCSARGLYFQVETAINFDIVVYDSDEYTVLSTISIDTTKLYGTSGFWYAEFAEDIIFEKDTFYRIVWLPTVASGSVITQSVSMLNDAETELNGMMAYPEGIDCICTTFNGTPTSGSHAWTDIATSKPYMRLLINQIDIPAGGAGGGLPILGGSIVR